MVLKESSHCWDTHVSAAPLHQTPMCINSIVRKCKRRTEIFFFVINLNIISKKVSLETKWSFTYFQFLPIFKWEKKKKRFWCGRSKGELLTLMFEKQSKFLIFLPLETDAFHTDLHGNYTRLFKLHGLTWHVGHFISLHFSLWEQIAKLDIIWNQKESCFFNGWRWLQKLMSKAQMTALARLGLFQISSIFEHASFQSTFHWYLYFLSSNISVFPGMHMSITTIIRLKFTFKTFCRYWFRSTFKHRPASTFRWVWEVPRAHLESRNKPSEINEISVGPIFISGKGEVKSSKPKTIYKRLLIKCWARMYQRQRK